jgi:hypothetical protein
MTTANYLINASSRCSHGPVGRPTQPPQIGSERNAPQARGYIVDLEQALDASGKGGLS